MKKKLTTLFISSLIFTSIDSEGAFTLTLNSTDFATTSVFNTITFFEFDITIDEPLVAGANYTDPALISVDYRVNGSLPNPTPSGFPAFALVRSMDGTEFYNLSPESSLTFSISPSANLSDGLQFNELGGTGTVFSFNARELNQNPGRYHPPILTLNSDGSGRLVNANNQSTFPNPPPPIGSGMLVNVDIADEYDTNLAFNTNLTIAIPEPTSSSLLAISLVSCFLVRKRKKQI